MLPDSQNHHDIILVPLQEEYLTQLMHEMSIVYAMLIFVSRILVVVSPDLSPHDGIKSYTVNDETPFTSPISVQVDISINKECEFPGLFNQIK